MPYIKQSLRERVDKEIDDLSSRLRCFDEDEIEGVLNYTITRLLCNVKPSNVPWRYRYFNCVMGVLNCVTHEFYRRRAALYEDKAKEQNGDTYFF